MDGYLSWIPTKVIEGGASAGAIRTFLLISGLTKAKGYCFASNSYLAERLQASPRSIQNWLGELVELEVLWVGIQNQNERKVYLWWERPKADEGDILYPRKDLRTPHAKNCAPIDNNQDEVLDDDKRGSTKTGKRITERLGEVEECPAGWIHWAISKHGFTAAECQAIFIEFFRYWAGESGQRARKLNWFSTFQNRCDLVVARVKARRGQAAGSGAGQGGFKRHDHVAAAVDAAMVDLYGVHYTGHGRQADEPADPTCPFGDGTAAIDAVFVDAGKGDGAREITASIADRSDTDSADGSPLPHEVQSG